MINEEIIINNAIKWSKSYLGSNEYALKCLGFIQDAIEKSNDIEIVGGYSAKESADFYNVYENIGLPPKGAFIFYNCECLIDDELMNLGHCGLSLGNGEVIHSWDVIRIDNYLDVENLNENFILGNPKYIGWAPIERVLIGCQYKSIEDNRSII